LIVVPNPKNAVDNEPAADCANAVRAGADTTVPCRQAGSQSRIGYSRIGT